jgi:hypothetical protein
MSKHKRREYPHTRLIDNKWLSEPNYGIFSEEEIYMVKQFFNHMGYNNDEPIWVQFNRKYGIKE